MGSMDLRVVMPDGEERVIDGNTMTAAQALSDYNQALSDWQNNVVLHREEQQRLMGVLDAQKGGGYIVDPTRPTQAEAANTHKITRTATVRPQRWQTNGGVVLAAGVPVQAWPGIPSLDRIEVFNTGNNPLKVAESLSVLRNGGGIGVAPGGSFPISVQASGWMLSPAGTTADVLWLFWESPDTNLPPTPKDES